MDEIVIDYREQNGILEKIAKKFPYQYKLENLITGDMIVNGTLCIERKTPADFVHSITDGRLFDQAIKMKNNYPACVIAVEGRLAELLYKQTKGNLNINAIMGTVASLTVDFNIPVVFMDKYSQLLYYHFINRMFKQKSSAPRVHVVKEDDPDKARLAVLCSVPHVGGKKAHLILKEFGSVANAISNVDNWERVEGIGNKIIESAKEVLYGKYNNEI